MSVFSPDRLPTDPARALAVSDARLVIETAKAILQQSAFTHNLPVAVLSKIALDEKLPVRERRNAAQALANYQLKAVEVLGHLTGAREASLSDLGVDDPAASPSVNVTQVNQVTRVEIHREEDWRGSGASSDA